MNFRQALSLWSRLSSVDHIPTTVALTNTATSPSDPGLKLIKINTTDVSARPENYNNTFHTVEEAPDLPIPIEIPFGVDIHGHRPRRRSVHFNVHFGLSPVWPHVFPESFPGTALVRHAQSQLVPHFQRAPAAEENVPRALGSALRPCGLEQQAS
jgi:hypothetical protein